jgi:hypothetical protein
LLWFEKTEREKEGGDEEDETDEKTNEKEEMKIVMTRRGVWRRCGVR